jgi:predicted glycosyltransferase
LAGKVLFYVQHLLGIGHLARASLICQALETKGFTVKLVMGGVPVKGVPDKNLDIAQLPPLKAGCIRFNDLADEHGQTVDQKYLDGRRDLLLSIFDDFAPDIVVIEAFPFGRRAMRFELLPLLERISEMKNKPFVAGSVRDILQEKKRPDRLQETVDILNRHFDALMVHGDARFARLAESFQMADKISIPIEYTGVVSAQIPPLTGKAFDVVVSAGGGVTGFLLMKNAVKAIALTSLAGASWCFLTGQNLPDAERCQLEKDLPDNVTVATHRADFRAMLGEAKLSVSQAGYNTTADILRAQCRSVLIPFAQEIETEQANRAAKLVQMGRVEVVLEEGLTPAGLAKAIDRAMASNQLASDLPIDLEGASNTAKFLRNKFEKH